MSITSKELIAGLRQQIAENQQLADRLLELTLKHCQTVEKLPTFPRIQN